MTDDPIQAAAEAILAEQFGTPPTAGEAMTYARAALSAAAPLIRQAALTEAADAIQATLYYVYPAAEGEDLCRLAGLRTARDAAATLVRKLAEPDA